MATPTRSPAGSPAPGGSAATSPRPSSRATSRQGTVISRATSRQGSVGQDSTQEHFNDLIRKSRVGPVSEASSPPQSSRVPSVRSRAMTRRATKLKSLRFPSTSPLTLEFLQWANSHWDLIETLFTLGLKGSPPRTLSEHEWCEGIRDCGYRGDARDAFRVIALDFGDGHSEENTHVTIDALRKFESPAARFIQIMREKHGTLLRAWRLELNKDGNATLTYSEFAEACRNLGLANQGRSLWQSIHPTGQLKDTKLSPMTFADFSTEEAKNLEDFSEGLWNTVAMDLDEAWRIMDERKLKFIKEEDFINALPKLGYQGSGHNATFIFRGLASGFGHALGQARMGRADLDVLLVLTKRGQCLEHLPPDMAELLIWVNRKMGGPAAFLEAMELDDQETVQVYDLAKGLRLLGYPGDHTQTAAHVAKFCRNSAGTQLRVKALSEVLETGRKPLSKREGSYTRFGALGNPGRQVSRGSNGDRWGRSAGAGTLGPQPVAGFNFGGANQADINRMLPASCRQYFGDSPHKPVRDEMRNRMRGPSREPSPVPSPRPPLNRGGTAAGGPRAAPAPAPQEEAGAAPDQLLDDDPSDYETETESTSRGDDAESTL